MRIYTFLFLLISVPVLGQNFQKSLMPIPSYQNSAAIQSVTTFYYGVVAANELLKIEAGDKLGYSITEKFYRGTIIESITRDPNSQITGKITYVYDDENCIIEIINSYSGTMQLTYNGDEVEKHETVYSQLDDLNSFEVYTLDHEGDILKIDTYYEDGSTSYCTIDYDDKKTRTQTDCDLLQLQMNETNEQQQAEVRKFRNQETHVIEEVIEDIKTVYTYNYGLLAKEEMYINNVFRYKWTYTYDSFGNWIEKQIFYGNVLKEKHIRKIHYNTK
ncbi:MAG: hypothetical protein AAF617_04755 [Bacteroidota bacterium]